MVELIRDIAHEHGLNVILSSHLLPDVDDTCDHVLVLSGGRVRRAGTDCGAEGARAARVRGARERRRRSVRGGAAARRARLSRHGRGRHAGVRPGRTRFPRSLLGRGGAGCPGPPLSRQRPDARRRLRRRGRERSSADPRSGLPPLHRPAEPAGREWWVIARAGVLERVRERRFLALLLLAWSPFMVRALQIYASSSFAQLSFLAPIPTRSASFSISRARFVFHHRSMPVPA